MGCKHLKYIYIIGERERERESERNFLLLLFYWVVCKNKRWDVGCIVK